MRRLLAGLAVAALAVGLAACTPEDGLADQYRDGDNKGYIAANGFQYAEYAPDERGESVQFTGTLDTGEEASSDDYTGRVLVVNFWYAACGPCIVEAPYLEEVYQSFDRADVDFVGVNTYDQAATAQSFARENEIGYPSLLAVNDAALKLAFTQHTSLSATPTTLVLDREGRVAARLIGALEEASILEAMVRDVVAEQT
jgi:peroxiredoxin